MKYYYFNKVAMAVLLALLLFFGTRTLIDIVYEEHEPETPGYEVAGAEEDLAHGGEKKGGDEDKGAAFIAALNKADPAKGEQAVGLCKVCHSFEKGGPNMIGPDLYGVVGHKIASREGFSYTAALKGHEGEWTFENLDHWLENPAEFAPGTSMAFPGIKDLQKRADVIAYLNQNSDEPLPIPEPSAAPAADESAEAEENPDKAAPQILALLSEADPAKGEQAAALCKVCHTFDAGGANGIGPNLHNVVGAQVAHHEGYNYSAPLKEKGGDWTYERLDEWLTNPAAFAPGTTMAFPGIPDAKKRADVIAYLRSQTENPPELPAGDAEAAPAEEKAKSENADDPGLTEEDAAPAEEEAKPAEEPAPAEDKAAPAEEPATEESTDEAAPAEEEAKPAEEAAPAEDKAAPAEEPAAEESTDEAAPAEEPAAEESTDEAAPADDEAKPAEEAAPAEQDAMGPAEEAAPAAAEEAAPATDESMQAEEPAASDSSEADAAAPEAMEDTASDSDTVVNSPKVSDDAPSQTHKGEPPSSSQPQPVYPDGKPDGI